MSNTPYLNVSDSDNDEDDKVLNDFRTANSRFQERLLAAQHDALEKQIESDIEKSKQQESEPSNTADEIEHLQRMIEKEEREVAILRKELDDWQHKRHMEATTSLLTVEERAQRVEQEHGDNGQSSGEQVVLTATDVDSIFDYLFELARAALPQNAADIDNTAAFGLMEPNEHTADKIFDHPDIIEQQKLTHVAFTKMENVFVENENGNYRKCMLNGKAYDAPFSVSFAVSTSLMVSDLEFEVSADLLLDARPLFIRIKEENNLHLFFRLVQHYGHLEYEKNRTFDYLINQYKDTDIRVTNDDISCLEFTSKWDTVQLNLTWLYKSTKDTPYDKLDVNICEQLMPQVRLAMIAEPRTVQFNTVMEQLPEKFDDLATTHGVIYATVLMVGMILQEPHKNKRQELPPL